MLLICIRKYILSHSYLELVIKLNSEQTSFIKVITPEIG